MTVGILATSNGPHPADKWALATAQQLFPVDQAVVGDKLLAAQKLQVAVAEKLVAHHENVQTDERASLQADAAARFAAPFGAEAHVEAAYADIVAAAKGTLWEAHVLRQEVVEAMKDVLHNHFKTSQHIERSWHQDRNAR